MTFREEQIGPCRLILGDCLEVLPTLGTGIANAIVTDPPYFVPATHYQTRTGSSRSLTDLGILEHYFSSVFRRINTVLTDDGFAYVFCDGQSYPVMYCCAYPYFKAQRPLVWDKLVAFTGYGWRHQHELILWCQRENAPAVPTGDGDILKCRAVAIKERGHLAEKPVELLEKVIQKTKPKVVLDPFMGSGSTGEACLNTGGCVFIGIEKEPRYFDLACQRIESVYRMPPVETQPELFGETA
jgi:site-specific DNA-methyltransferase (adenine-specific)